MADHWITVPKLDDKTILNLMRSLIAKKVPSNGWLEIVGMPRVRLTDEKYESLVEKVESNASFLIFKFHLAYPGFAIEFSRETSTVIDKVKTAFSDQQDALDHNTRLDLLQVIEERVGQSATGGGLPSRAIESADDLSALYRATVLRLETKFAEQIEKITSWTVTQTAAFEEKKLALADETKAERATLQAEFEQKSEALRRLEDELENKRRSLDDRDYMHARRAIRGDLQQLIAAREKQFSLTPGTRRLRSPVHAVILTLIGALIILNAANFSQLSGLDWSNPTYVLLWGLLKQGALAAALVGTVFFYVRWMNRWFEQHANAEFLLKQFQLDIDRASWVVETALEWRRSEQGELPGPLLAGITRNLFTREENSEHPSAADELASALLGSASNVKVKVGDNEMSFSRQGLKKLSKTEISSP